PPSGVSTVLIALPRTAGPWPRHRLRPARPPPTSPLFPYTTLFRSGRERRRPHRGPVGVNGQAHVARLHVPELHGAVVQRHGQRRSEEHTSELQSPCNLVCRLLLEKKNQASASPTGGPCGGRPPTRP